MSTPNHNCCAKCARRTDRGLLKKKRHRIKSSQDYSWLQNWFTSLGVDTKKYQFLCDVCFKYLRKLKNDKSGKIFHHHNIENSGLASRLKKVK